MNTQLDPAVKVQMPCNLEAIHHDEKNSHNIKNVEIAFKSDLMQNYENGTLFTSKKELKSVHFQNQLLNFSIGTDGELYMIQKDAKGKNYWNHKGICQKLIKEVQEHAKISKPEVLSFNLTTAVDSDSSAERLIAFCCLGNHEDEKNHTMYVSTSLNVEKVEDTEWISLGNVLGLHIESVNLAHIQNDAEDEMSKLKLVCNGRKQTGENLYSYYYNTNKKIWVEVNFEQFDQIKDVQFGQHPIDGLAAYAIGSYDGAPRFSVTPLDTRTQEFKQPSTDVSSRYFKKPVAFILETIDDPDHEYYGCSEVYMIEKNDQDKNEIKFLSAQAQDYNIVSETNGVVTISVEFEGEAEKIFFNKNTEGRIDLYAHITQNETGQLLHTYHPTGKIEDVKRWCPIYTLENDISIVSPASNADGRICEVFMAATNNTNLRYLWQDDKLFSWHRENVYVEAIDHAIPVDSMQTKITFYDAATKEPIIFPALKESFISITPLEAVSVEINHKKYVLNKRETVTLSTKQLIGEIIMNINVSKADAPYFEIEADFLPSEKIIIHPVEKIQQTMGSINATHLKNPKDRYGNEVKNLVAKEDEAHIDAIVEAVNKTVQFTSEKFAQHANISFTAKEKAAADKEGVWMLPKETVFDTKLDMETLNGVTEGPLFAIDFSGEVPVFLDREACLAQKIGVGTVEAKYVGFWDDLAKHFGAFVEAIKNTVEKVTKFVAEKVKEGIKLIVTIAGKAVECIVKFAEQIMSTVLMMLEKFLKIALEKMLKWLGFVFDIDYIRAIQKEFANNAKRSITNIKEGVKDAKTQITFFMNNIKRSLKDGALLVNITNKEHREKIVTLLKNSDQEALKKFFISYEIQLQGHLQITELEAHKQWQVADSKQQYIVYNDEESVEIRVKIELSKVIQSKTPKEYQGSIQQEAEQKYRAGDKEKAAQQKDALQNDPTVNWGMTVLKSVPSKGIPSIGIENIVSVDINDEIKKTISTFFKDTIGPLASAENENKTLQGKMEKFIKYLKEKPSLGEIFLYISKNLLEIGLELMEAIVNGLLTAINALATMFENLLTAELKIPILRELFKIVVGDDTIPFNMINAVSLLLAVPASIFCKLIGLKTPTSNTLVKEPEWWFYIKTYGGLVIDCFKSIATLGEIAYNWIQKADPTGEAGKYGAIIFSGFNILILNPISLLLNNPILYAENPISKIGKLLHRLNLTQWFVKVVGGAISAGNMLLSTILPNLASDVYAIIMSIMEGAIDVVLNTVKLICEIILFADDKKILKLVDSILNYLRNIGSTFADVCKSFGNILPSIEVVSIILKAIFHGMSMQLMMVNTNLQVAQVIIQTIDYNSSDTTSEFQRLY